MIFLTRIEDLFQITSVGLVVVPGPLRSAVECGEGLPVELRSPDGKLINAKASLRHVLQRPPPPANLAIQWLCVLTGVTKEQVPIGTEVWWLHAAKLTTKVDVSHQDKRVDLGKSE